MKKLTLILLTTSSILFSLTAQDHLPFIVVDQFGYPTDAKKIAVIRDPRVGFDAELEYQPGTSCIVINYSTGDTVFTGTPVAWNSGLTDASSGDKAWHFDFSTLSLPGTYIIRDTETGETSFPFRVADNVYTEILKQAMRTFFYQRVGFAKEVPYAEEGWADGASHMGSNQDPHCRSFFDKNNPAGEIDVSGGWYDAGDYNKYTSWTAGYVTELMKSYIESPASWTDDYNIPESGNGIPDILDEAKWGIDHLVRLQQDDGGVLSIVGEASASPPSATTGASYYGPPNTTAALNTSAALAISSVVFREIGMSDYADTLQARAEKAWQWSVLYPDSLFNNNSSEYNSQGLGAGRMEVTDPYARTMIRLKASCFLFEATGDIQYRDYFDSHYNQAHLFAWTYAYPYESETQDVLLYYSLLDNGTQSVRDHIRNTYRTTMNNNGDNFPAYDSKKDPYLAHLDSYTWGSNQIKSAQGNMFMDIVSYQVDPALYTKANDAAFKYINYIHGVNPLNFVYLSNMYAYGAENGVNEFYHSWFKNGSPKWDRVGVSTYGPAPGFLTGGANPSYSPDGCCPSSCGSSGNNAVCSSEDLTPPMEQPKQKSYKDFNTSWPLNSWSISENSLGYQTKYIRLLSKYVNPEVDCNGVPGGTAFFDSCGNCAGGNTGITPVIDPLECEIYTDCNGTLWGSAFLDSCGNCAGGYTGIEPDLLCLRGDTMYIEGRYLYTSEDEKVILKGVNEMFVHSDDKTGTLILPEIAKTGANSVRLVWTESYGNKDELVSLIDNCIANKMIAIPECHDATGKWEDLDICVGFWKDPVLIEGIQRNKKWTLINIGNEVGDASVSDEQFISGYQDAIDSLRSWGYTVPIIIDAANWGQDAGQVIRTWQEISEHDSLGNVLFSVHSYWPTTENYTKIANESMNNGMPVIVGEGPSPTRSGDCGTILDYQTGMEILDQADIGWLAWSWGYVSNGDCEPWFDITSNGQFGSWETEAGANLVTDDPYSIMRTAERPLSFFGDGIIPVSSVYLSPRPDSLVVGDQIKLNALVAPFNATNSTYSYDIGGDGTISFQQSSGALKALTPGNVNIRLISGSDPGLDYTLSFVITSIDVSSIIINPENASMKTGDTLLFSVDILPPDASFPDYSLTVDGDQGILSLDEQNMRIIAKNPGNADVVASWDHGNISARMTVSVSFPDDILNPQFEDVYRIFPNPLAKNELSIEFRNAQSGIIRFVDITGKEIYNQEFRESEDISINKKDLRTGILFCIIETGDYRKVCRLVVN